jgi:glucan phosphoethanolaminetransferase (alkaline phosphatase superfamily)
MKNISAKYIGLITGGVMVLISLLLFYQFKFSDTGAVKIICYSVFSVGIIITLLNFNRASKEEKTFKEYFSEGFKMFVVVVLIMAVFTFVFYKLNPQIFESILAEINKYNAADVNKTAIDVAENSDKLRRAFMPMTVATNTIMYLIIGALVTVCGAGFLSQKK